jgi:hypothetical protein
VDILKDASGWLEDQRMKFRTGPVVYRRGNDSVEVAATVGKTIFEVRNEFGLIEKTETRDFLILAADLVLNDLPVLPKRGDQVRETVGSKVFVYEVMAPGKVPEWCYSDPYRKTLRVHTKHAGMEDAP